MSLTKLSLAGNNIIIPGQGYAYRNKKAGLIGRQADFSVSGALLSMLSYTITGRLFCLWGALIHAE
jgi:hypothetical protein